MAEPLDIVIVGAGAVGQVYGLHLQAGGARVRFHVRPRHLEHLDGSFRLWQLGSGAPVERTLIDCELTTTVEELLADPPDQLWLALPSTAIQDGAMDAVLAAVPEAVVVGLPPGPEDQELLLQCVDADRLVSGFISMVAYAAPLPGETRFAAPGLAYWLPPMAPSRFSGPRAVEVVAALRAGGMSARESGDVTAENLVTTAAFQALIGALEAEEWRIAALAAHGAQALAAAREAACAVAAARGRRVPLLLRWARPWMLRGLIWLAPRVVPLPLERYLATHFGKVGAQTRLLLDGYLRLARERGLPHDALSRIRGALSG